MQTQRLGAAPGEIPFWARPSGVCLLLAVYLLLHFGLRLALGEVVGIDDAEQALFAQQFEWSYRYRAPPLFTWILLGLQHVMEPGILPINLIRYALLAIIYGFTYLTARLLINDIRLSALATYSLATVYVYGFYSHHDLTHTTMMATGLAIAWYAAVRIFRNPAWYWYALLGLASAVGILGKWNFAIFLVALLSVSLALPELRRRIVFTPKFLIAPIVLLLLVGPTVISTFHWGPEGNDSIARTIGAGDGFSLLAIPVSLGRGIGIFLIYSLPFLLIALLSFWPSMDRAFLSPALPRRGKPLTDTSLVFLVMAVASAIFFMIVIGLDAEALTERMLQPALYPITLLFFALLELKKPDIKQIRTMAISIAIVMAISLVARVGTYVAQPFGCSSCRMHIPVEALASELTSAGFRGNGTIVVDDHHLGGNLRIRFPNARIADLEQPLRYWSQKSPADGACVFVRQLKKGDKPAKAQFRRFDHFLLNDLSGDPEQPYTEQIVDLDLIGLSDRKLKYAYRIYENGNGECR